MSAIDGLVHMVVTEIPPHLRGDALRRLDRVIQDARDDERAKTLHETDKDPVQLQCPSCGHVIEWSRPTIRALGDI